MTPILSVWCDENIGKLADLVGINGGSLDPKGGGPKKADNVWGRVGLTIQEVFDLIALTQYAMGIMAGSGVDDRQEFLSVLGERVRRKISGSTICLPTTEELKRFSRQRP